MEELVEAIREGVIVKVPESVAREEDLFILRRPMQTEKVEVVSIAPKKPSAFERIKESYSLERASPRFDYSKNNVVGDLIDNFHWTIIKTRRDRNMSRKRLSEAIGVPEEELKVVENGQLPKDDYVIINRIEEYFKISLRKNPGVGASKPAL